jgi:hypothetical protein
MDQCAAERDALLHAAGELPRKTLGEAVEPDGLEQRLGLVAVVLPLTSELAAVRLDDLERQEHVVDDLAPGQEIRVLERHAGDLDRPAYPIAENHDVAGIGGHQPGHDLHQRRLAAARGPHHRSEFATGDVEARVPQGENAAARAAVGQRDVIDINGAGHGCHRTAPMSRSLGYEERRVTVRRRPGTVPSVAMPNQRWQYRVTLRRVRDASQSPLGRGR